MLPFLYLSSLLLLVYSTFAQDLSVPNAWQASRHVLTSVVTPNLSAFQDPTTSLNRTERENLATKSIAVLTSIINSTSGQIDGTFVDQESIQV